MTKTRRGLFLKAAVVLGGAVGLVMNPAQARPGMAQALNPGTVVVAPPACVWCSDTCADLIGFCSGKNCPTGNATCSNATGCQGVSGHWYDYKITCS